MAKMTKLDPLIMRGIKLSGDYFIDCNLLVDIILEDMKTKAEAVKIIKETCQSFGIPLPNETIKRLSV